MKFFAVHAVIAGLLLACSDSLHAARMYIEAPEIIPVHQDSFVATITLSSQGRELESIDGVFSFPSESFDVGTIIVRNPALFQEIDIATSTPLLFGSKTKVHFKGQLSNSDTSLLNEQPILTVELYPKKDGTSYFSLNDIEIIARDEAATLLSTQSYIAPYTVTAPDERIIHEGVAVENLYSKWKIVGILIVIGVGALLTWRVVRFLISFVRNYA